MEWIPVTERLPEMPVDAEGFPVSGEVLTFTREKEWAIATCHEYGEGPMWIMEGEGDYELYGVTHWMPLPAPPLPFNAELSAPKGAARAPGYRAGTNEGEE